MKIENPFRPGAGHTPPFLAGRSREKTQFAKLLEQDVVSQNVVLTGLRGVGKTVLMDLEYKPLAQKHGWIWVGTDLSEHAFIDERNLCRRLLTDLSVFTSTLSLRTAREAVGFRKGKTSDETLLDFAFLEQHFEAQPGLIVDKLKSTLEFVWKAIRPLGMKGLLFAYDEAQVVRDRKDKDQYPLALLLETFQSIQRRDLRYMLLLTGLPTLFPKLVESRTYAERMFTVQEVGRLTEDECREAILTPLKRTGIAFAPHAVSTIIERSGGYPYFIQFICREVFEQLGALKLTETPALPLTVPVDPILRKLDGDFFSGRWNKVPDRQRDLLFCIASLDNCDQEFTISEIVEASRKISAAGKVGKPFRTNDVSQMLPRLIEAGLVYKNRHGKYSFAVPLFGDYIRRNF
jgi:hypothetical protein